jgi:hypothetical protein
MGAVASGRHGPSGEAVRMLSNRFALLSVEGSLLIWRGDYIL